MSLALAQWLRQELPARGYQIGPAGSRGGGVKRFAEDAGLTQASASRALKGENEPSLDALRKIGALLGQTLGQMLVIAEIATVTELSTGTPPDWRTSPPGDLWAGVDWEGLSSAERWLWHTPDTTDVTRNVLAGVYRSLEGEDRAGSHGLGVPPIGEGDANIA